MSIKTFQDKLIPKTNLVPEEASSGQAQQLDDSVKNLDPNLPLSQGLKQGTWDIHQALERSPFVLNLFKGTLSREVYAKFLVSLYYVYEAMEEEFARHKDHPILGPIYFPKELNRTETLHKDIDFYLGQGWKEANPITPAIQSYVDIIKADSESHPHRLVAHSYTRYLGDLSGGQMMSRKVKKNYSLESEEGVQFFLFEHIESPKSFKEMYRQKLDELEVDLDTKNDIIQATIGVFKLNGTIFDEMDSLLPPIKKEDLDAFHQFHKNLHAKSGSNGFGFDIKQILLILWFSVLIYYVYTNLLPALQKKFFS